MKAIITGASSGLGYQYALKLANDFNYDVVIAARSTDKLYQLKKLIKTKVTVETVDLSKIDQVIKFAQKYQDQKIDLLINNAGFGTVGSFKETICETEVNLVDLNIKALMVLTKLFYQKFLKENHGRIINIGSLAGYLPGPFFSTYYGSKAFVNNFTNAIWYEAKYVHHSDVRVVLISPGSIKTNFNRIASPSRSSQGRDSNIFTTKSLKKALKTQSHTVIIGPDKTLYFLAKILFSTKLKMAFVFRLQKKRLT